MLTVKTLLHSSPIHGLGVFADEFILKGTVIWEFREPFDAYLTDEFVENLPDVARQTIHRYCDHDSSGWLVVADDSRFFNHSGTPNTTVLEDSMIANRDIAVGEEITQDYGASCDLHMANGWIREAEASNAGMIAE